LFYFSFISDARAALVIVTQDRQVPGPFLFSTILLSHRPSEHVSLWVYAQYNMW